MESLLPAMAALECIRQLLAALCFVRVLEITVCFELLNHVFKSCCVVHVHQVAVLPEVLRASIQLLLNLLELNFIC